MSNLRKIDVYAHVVPPKIAEMLFKTSANNPSLEALKTMIRNLPSISDMDARFRIMDRQPEVTQVLSVCGFSIEQIATNAQEASDLAQRVNDEIAELVYKYPERFAAGTAILPMNDIDLALKELDRAVNDLKFKGVILRIPINGKPVDRPEFMPLYEKMCQYNLPILWHPEGRRDRPDYADEKESKYFIWHLWGLVVETTLSMTRMVFSGVMEQFPKLKIITHHCGAMVPYFAGRIVNHYNQAEMRYNWKFKEGLTEPHINYFRRFYNDTAILGNTPALMCAHAFCGADHLLFGTDFPFDPEIGAYGTRQTVEAIEEMTIPDAEKRKIFADNARQLLRLSA